MTPTPQSLEHAVQLVHLLTLQSLAPVGLVEEVYQYCTETIIRRGAEPNVIIHNRGSDRGGGLPLKSYFCA